MVMSIHHKINIIGHVTKKKLKKNHTRQAVVAVVLNIASDHEVSLLPTISLIVVV